MKPATSRVWLVVFLVTVFAVGFVTAQAPPAAEPASAGRTLWQYDTGG